MLLSPVIFGWEAESSGWHGGSEGEVRRSYGLWEHAEEILENDRATDLARIDALTTLKRCVDQRLKLLAAVYKFDRLPIKLEGRLLDRLHALAIVRPLMIRKLFEIRNFIEHRGALPPDLFACRELSEFAWYFLRSTDRFTAQAVEGINMKPELAGTSPY